METITVKIAAVLDEEFKEELRELVRIIVKEEVSKETNRYTINVTTPKVDTEAFLENLRTLASKSR